MRGSEIKRCVDDDAPSSRYASQYRLLGVARLSELVQAERASMSPSEDGLLCKPTMIQAGPWSRIF